MAIGCRALKRTAVFLKELLTESVIYVMMQITDSVSHVERGDYPVVKFESIPEEKQTAVLNAAFSCFGKNGYKKTSVADVAAAAGISKASVFQYFRSKKELYMYLFEYACDRIIGETPMGTDDFFECLQIGTEVKMRVMALHPGMYDFLASLVTETEDAIISETKTNVQARIGKVLGGLMGNVNWNKLKPGVDRDMLLNTVRWVNEGYLRSAIGQKDAETIRRELFEYFELIKKAYYKEEYLP